MYRHLDKVNSPSDIKNMKNDELNLLAQDIRNFLIESISKTGGHLGSNLGVVELTLALHKVFESPTDKIVWDVGHQSYVHKILTGRKDEFSSLRQFKGLSGFPKENESKHDIFDTGHSSTSISVATGIACARDIKNDDYNVISVIGDGSITGGMALEALNHLGYIDTDMIIILNDNEMSIDKNVGGISKCLSNLIKSARVNKVKDEVEKVLSVTPGGNLLSKTANKMKDSIISKFSPQQCELFESLGIKYYGPIDGHNLEELIFMLEKAKSKKGPVLLHVITEKGKGYKPAQEYPEKYHGVSPFDLQTGIQSSKVKSISNIVGDKLTNMAKDNEKIVAITAAMPSGTGLKNFSEIYPKRYYDVGIAEQHATTFAAGLAKNDIKPYFAVYSSFLQRAYDQIIHDVSITQKPVTFLIDRAGLVGNDGETHHGMFDLSYLNSIPNMIVMAPKDTKELEHMLDLTLEIDNPIAIRYPRGNEYHLDKGYYGKLEVGKYEVLDEGKDIAILAIGKMVESAVEAKEILIKENINPTIVNARFLKPIDEELLHDIFKKYNKIITIEDNVIVGGFGSRINKFAIDNNYSVNIKNIGLPEIYVEHGNVDELYESVDLSPKCIAKTIKDLS